jgi:hypothetical protein
MAGQPHKLTFTACCSSARPRGSSAAQDAPGKYGPVQATFKVHCHCASAAFLGLQTRCVHTLCAKALFYPCPGRRTAAAASGAVEKLCIMKSRAPRTPRQCRASLNMYSIDGLTPQARPVAARPTSCSRAEGQNELQASQEIFFP